MLNYTIYGLYDLRDEEFYENIKYIGQTTRPITERLLGHKIHSRADTQRHVCRWIQKIGEENVGTQVLDTGAFISDDHLDALEISFISQGFEDGLDLKNLTSGGRGTRGYVWPEELVERRSGEGNSFYGKTHTEETKKLLSELRKDRWENDPELAEKTRQAFITNEKILKCWEGGENHPFYGKSHKDSTKELISEASKSFWSNRTPEQREEHRQSSVEAMHRRWHVKRDIIKPDCVYCQTTETNESEQTWNSPLS